MNKKGDALGKNIWWLVVAAMGFFVPSGAALIPVGIIAFLIMYTWDKKDESKAQVATTSVSAPKVSSKEKSEDDDDDKPIKCRFCKKYYSSEYNGCPYCKKK